MTRQILLIVSFFVLLHSTRGFSQDNMQTPTTYALVVGISKYYYIKPLAYADSDADLFTDLLRSGAGGKIRPENLFLLKNDSANAGNFWSSFSRIMNKDLKKGDRVYIYFAGHGDGIKGLNEYYLLLSDCQPGNDGNNYLLSFGAIDMYNLKNRMGLLTRRGVEVVLVLDACRTNELAGGYASQVFNTSILQSRVGEIAMLATGPGQVSIENASFGNGHGLFTYNLIDAFSGRADKEEGGNQDQLISLHELQSWVSKSVSNMATQFRTSQNPVFCCDDQGQVTMGVVDSSFHSAWNLKKGLAGKTENFQRNTNPRSNVKVDTALITLYQAFTNARKANNLWGMHSADYYYEQIKKQYPSDALAEDARYMLASDFINFAQQKINLYLEGKDLLSVEVMLEKNDSLNETRFLAQEYERLRKTISENWTIAGLMIQKAGRLLSNGMDSSMMLKLKPKVSFMLARGYLNEEKESTLSFEQALQFALEAYHADSSAAYVAECLGMLYAYRHSYAYQKRTFPGETGAVYMHRRDTMISYFKKALTLAPHWANSYRNMAMKAYARYYLDSTSWYMNKAISIDPRNASIYISYADYHRITYPDSSRIYYEMAMKYAPKSAWSDIYRKIGGLFFHYPYDTASTVFNIRYKRQAMYDSVEWFTRMAFSLDTTNIAAYLNMVRLFTDQGKMDSARLYNQRIIKIDPSIEAPYRVLIGWALAGKKTDSVLYYARELLRVDPHSGYASYLVAEHWEKRPGFSDSALLYYNRSLTAGYANDICRERIAYITMARDKFDPLPLQYFELMLKQPMSGWRHYYNIACYYSNQGNTSKSLEYLSLTLAKGMRQPERLKKDPYLNSIRDTQEFKDLLRKYNLE